MDRRTFLGNSLAGALAAGPWLTSARAADSPGAEKIRLGLIGCGWYGRVDVNAALKAGGVEVVAVCDVDQKHLEEAITEFAGKQGTRPKGFARHEDLLAVPGLQAVIIATPPHWHALQFLAALERGLDIYCEKPLAYDVREGQAMVAAAQRAGRIVQVGFQRRQATAIRQARDYVRAGTAGRIVQVDAQIHYTAGMRDARPQDPPPTLDWDRWCGPAPKLPYSPQVGHFAWRLEKAYGHGHLVDWGIHLIDAVRWTLGEGMPRTVQAAGGLYYFKDQITTPDVLSVHFDFASCPVTWQHRMWGAAEFAPEVNNGIFFRGEQETVFVTDDRWVVIPRDSKQTRRVQTVASDAGGAHMAEFLASVRSRQAPSCLPEDAWQSTATVQLAAAAYETGARVEWDAARREVVGNAAAAALLRRPYRSPWIHPAA